MSAAKTGQSLVAYCRRRFTQERRLSSRRAITLAIGSVFLLSACGNPDHRALEQMIEDRVGRAGYESISEVAVYREGDAKRACLVVQLRNNWGERLPPTRVKAWYVWNSKSWHFDNFLKIEDGRTCQELALLTPSQRAAEADQRRQQDRAAVDRSFELAQKEEQAGADAAARASTEQSAAQQTALEAGRAGADGAGADKQLNNSGGGSDAE